MPNKRYGSYLTTDTLWFTVGQVVWLPQPLKVKQFFEMFKNAEKWHRYLACGEIPFLEHFFQKAAILRPIEIMT